MHYLNEQTINTVIDLAEHCYPQQEMKFGNSINPFTDVEVVENAFKPVPEREKLVRYMDELDDNEKTELMALMWLGRRRGGSSQWESLVGLAKQEISDSATYLADNTFLAIYLKDGLSRR